MTARPFGLRDDPFVEGHDRRFVYAHRTHRAAVERLTLAIGQGAPFVLLTGPGGAGKTTILLAVLQGLGERPVAHVVATPETTIAMLRSRVLEAIGADASAAADATAFAQALSARPAEAPAVLLALDDVHRLDDTVLIEVRGLAGLEAHGHRALVVMLTGGPALESRLEREHEGLKQRIAVRCVAEPMSPRETEAMLHHRVAVCGGPGALFPRPTCRAIHELTHGVAREVQSLGAAALGAAHEAHAPAVQPEHVAAAARALGFRSVLDAGGAARAATPATTATVAPSPAKAAARPAPPPATTPVVTPAKAAPVGASAAAVGDETPAPVASGPAVDAWVARFRDPGGPPRIGSRVATETPPPELPRRRTPAPASAPATVADTGEAAAVETETSDVAPPPPARDRRRRPRGRVVGHGPLRPSRYARRDHTSAWIAMLVVAGAIGAFVWLRQHRHPAAAPKPPATTPTAAPAGPVEGGTSVVPARVDARTAATRSRVDILRPAPPPPAVTDSVAATRRYMIVVGSYLDEDKAHSERDRIATYTPLECQVVKGREDGADVFRVLVGPVPSRHEANRVGDQLFSQGAVNEASVIRWSAADPAPH